MKEEAKEWMKQSNKDLKHAKNSLESKDFEWAQFASQQAAEKALKAVCIHKNIGLIKTHDLTMLARKLNAPKDILENCSLLNPFYTTTRYPDDEQDKKVKEDAAKDARKFSNKVVKWCKEQIKT